MNHTPGQWTTQTYSPGVDQDGDPFENQIRVITRTCEVASGIQCEHDARLIAAAPDLLAALESLNAAVIRAGYGNTAMPELSEAWAAIARATGEVDHVVD